MLDRLLNQEEKPVYRDIVKWMWRLTFAGIAAVILLFIFLSFTDLPSVSQLENPKSSLASQVFAADGKVLGRYYTENRVPVGYDELSPHLISALIATEDERYFEHSGIDFPALGRVAVKTVLLGQRSSGGASTITQQLAKLLFTEHRATSLTKRVFQKLKEWIIAVRLERKYTKVEIIAMYLNKFDFINGAYGIKAASEIYFGKPQDSLAVQEAAMLVGMLKNPSLFNPLRRQDTVLHRRMVVLKQMEKNGLLTAAEYDTLRQKPLGINYTRQTHIDGLAPYFRMELAKEVKNILARPENHKTDGSEYDIYRDGLKIYTTIDSDIQRIAEQEMTKHMAKVQKVFWRRWKNLDPWTFETDSKYDIPVAVRKEKFNDLLRESDRYQAMREKYLDGVLQKMNKELPGFTFHRDDREIDRIVRERRQGGVIDDLVARERISRTLAAQYRQVMRSDHFPELQQQWDLLQEAAEQAFKTPVKMRVFAYNDQMETDTTMTPLDSIKYHLMFLQTGSLAVEPATGHVKAWIGGINHKYFQLDHVRSERQVGSTFKPFVYATAIALQGFSPCFPVLDVEQAIMPGDGNFSLNEPWVPRNADGVFTGESFTLKKGLAKSKNTVSVYLMKQLGDTEPVRGIVEQMGVPRSKVPPAPSICLGATDLTVMDMTGAYTTFANNGIYNRPIYLLRIEDRNGRVIYEELPEERQALPPNANYVMVEMLRYAGGMGRRFNSDAGGKTGTTNEYADGWFMGITPNLVVGTWVGGEYRWIRFRSLLYGQGAYMAKPFFISLIQRLEKEKNIDYDSQDRFYRPPGDLGIEMDCGEYQRQMLPTEDDEFEDEFAEDIFGDESY